MITYRPGLIMAMLFSIGIVIGCIFPLLKWMYITMVIVGASCRHWLIALVALGALMMAMHQQIPPKLHGIVQGIVISDVETKLWANGEKKEFVMRYPQGKARVQYFGKQELNFGDEIRLKGKWFRGPKKYQRFDDIHQVYWKVSVGAKNPIEVLNHHQGNGCIAIGLQIKNALKEGLLKYLPKESATTVIAMVLGDRGEMPKDIKDLFIRSGTAHILAISGMNMAVVGALFLFILKLWGIPRRWQMIVMIIILWLYALASGLSASVVRACLMASIILGGFIFDEESDPLNSLGVAAFILLAIDPGNLLDIGFQLSFAAVAGILLMTELISKKLNFLPLWLAQSLAVSASASIATAPILFYHFASFTPVSILSNILIVPLADIIFLLGLSLALSSLVIPIIAANLANCVNVLFHVLVWLAYFFSQIPGGHWQF